MTTDIIIDGSTNAERWGRQAAFRDIEECGFHHAYQFAQRIEAADMFGGTFMTAYAQVVRGYYMALGYGRTMQ